jgi:hypothetical protein
VKRRLLLDSDVVEYPGRNRTGERTKIWHRLREIAQAPDRFVDYHDRDERGRVLAVHVFNGSAILFWDDLADRYLKLGNQWRKLCDHFQPDAVQAGSAHPPARRLTICRDLTTKPPSLLFLGFARRPPFHFVCHSCTARSSVSSRPRLPPQRLLRLFFIRPNSPEPRMSSMASPPW